MQAALFYWNYYANLFFLVLLIGASVVNGASFYIDVFSKKYLTRVKRLEMEIQAAQQSGQAGPVGTGEVACTETEQENTETSPLPTTIDSKVDPERKKRDKQDESVVSI